MIREQVINLYIDRLKALRKFKRVSRDPFQASKTRLNYPYVLIDADGGDTIQFTNTTKMATIVVQMLITVSGNRASLKKQVNELTNDVRFMVDNIHRGTSIHEAFMDEPIEQPSNANELNVLVSCTTMYEYDTRTKNK